jgi:hypothetical protein
MALSLRRRRGRLRVMPPTPVCPNPKCGSLLKAGNTNLLGTGVLPSGAIIYTISCKFCGTAIGTVADQPPN